MAMSAVKNKLTLNVEGGKLLWVNGKPFGKKIVSKDGWSTRMAEFVLADGTKMIGVVEICDQDSGEHWGSGFIVADPLTIVFQDDKNFAKMLGKKESEIYPYRYRYTGWQEAQGTDHHIGADGWS